MKSMLLAAAAVLALGTASAQALPAINLDQTATQSTDAAIQQVHHWGYYGYYNYNYYGYYNYYRPYYGCWRYGYYVC
jgi:hypothetical protein